MTNPHMTDSSEILTPTMQQLAEARRRIAELETALASTRKILDATAAASRDTERLYRRARECAEFRLREMAARDRTIAALKTDFAERGLAIDKIRRENEALKLQVSQSNGTVREATALTRKYLHDRERTIIVGNKLEAACEAASLFVKSCDSPEREWGAYDATRKTLAEAIAAWRALTPTADPTNQCAGE